MANTIEKKGQARVDGIEASLDEGDLAVSVAKAEAEQPRRVKIT